MKEILSYISQILLIVLIIIQIIVMVYLFIVNHRRFKEDEKFWKHMDEEIQLSKQRLQQYLDENPEEEIVESEQDQ